MKDGTSTNKSEEGYGWSWFRGKSSSSILGMLSLIYPLVIE